MILKEFNLISFGKFKKETINLGEGLNILYGENESGKTTIHNFIEGMFYGFLRPYVTRRYYQEEYEKYRPWHGDQYTGVLRFSKDGKFYRIERDFGRGEVKVYEDLTGKDITKDIDNGERIKVHLPGIYFFDFNTNVYRNTISIKQLGTRIDTSLSTEVKDRLANISASLDEDISVKEALTDLEKQRKEIGTERAFTSPYGKAMGKLIKLKTQLDLKLEKQKEYNRYILEFNSLNEEIEIQTNNIEQSKLKLEKAQILKEKKTFEEALNIKEEIKSIEIQMDNLKPYSNLSFQEYTEALKLDNNIEHLGRQTMELSDKISNTEDKLHDMELEKDEGIFKGIIIDELYEDIIYYNDIEEEKNNLILNSQQNRLEILNSQLNNLFDKVNKAKSQAIIFFLLAVGFLGLGIIDILLSILALPIGILAVYNYNAWKKISRNIGDLDEKSQKIKIEEDKRVRRIDNIEKSQSDLQQKYKTTSKSELNRLYEDIRLIHMNNRNRAIKVQELKKEIEDNKMILLAKENEIKRQIGELKDIIHKNNSTSLEEFKLGLDKKRIYDDLTKNRGSKMEVLEKILGSSGLDELYLKTKDYSYEYLEEGETIDITKTTNEIKAKEEALLSMRDNYSRLEERIENLSKEIETIVDIEEEIDRLEKLILTFDNRIRSIDMARETIENISQEIHNQFAPHINKKVSQLIELVTNGKYDQVKINEDLNIAIENPTTKEIIDIEDLSGGTIDQLYFALRFSIINSIKDNNLPLILDDCFIQYDNERLKNILKFISTLSDKKQILLFTCHHREREILDSLGLKYNLIQLS